MTVAGLITVLLRQWLHGCCATWATLKHNGAPAGMFSFSHHCFVPFTLETLATICFLSSDYPYRALVQSQEKAWHCFRKAKYLSTSTSAVLNTAQLYSSIAVEFAFGYVMRTL